MFFNADYILKATPNDISNLFFENNSLEASCLKLFESKYPSKLEAIKLKFKSSKLDDFTSFNDIFLTCCTSSHFDPMIYAVFYQRLQFSVKINNIKAQKSYLDCVRAIKPKECKKIADALWKKSKNYEILEFLSIFGENSGNIIKTIPVALEYIQRAATGHHHPKAKYVQLVFKSLGFGFDYTEDDLKDISKKSIELEKSNIELNRLGNEIRSKIPKRIIPGFHWQYFVEQYETEWKMPVALVLAAGFLGVIIQSRDVIILAITMCPYLFITTGFAIFSKKNREHNIPLCDCHTVRQAHCKWVEFIPENAKEYKDFPEDKVIKNFITAKIILQWLSVWIGVALSAIFINDFSTKLLGIIISYSVPIMLLNSDFDIGNQNMNEYVKLVMAPLIVPFFYKNHRQCRQFLEMAERKDDGYKEEV